jgi:spermidine dehydrogenase
MDRIISRRDFMHGFGALSASAMLPMSSLAGGVGATGTSLADSYPPALSGLRGNHQGSFDVAHQLGLEGRRDWGTVTLAENKPYDLVVVGAGISGLAATHFYRKKHPGARILILDNHDDFGGHAKRNEFQLGERMLLGHGGSQTLQEPSGYSDIVKGLLADLGVDLKRFESAYDQNFYQRNKLGAGIHFNRERWGVDRVVPFDLGYYADYLPLAPSGLSAQQAVDKMPISAAAKIELLRLLLIREDQMPAIPAEQKWDYLYTLSYRDFLVKHVGIREAEVFAVLQDIDGDAGVGIEARSAGGALGNGLPGWHAAGLPEAEANQGYDEPYIHHFPDGNASIARMLVRRFIPAIAGGNSMEDVVTARFDYSQLDQPESPVRIRLNSTATRVEHDGDPATARQVKLTYVREGQAFQVHAGACVLACNNSVIPYLCDELPKIQRDALARQVKSPILYTNVVLRNWQAWKNLGIGGVVSPGSYHTNAMLDFPVSLGDYNYTADPDEPIVVRMERFPHRNNEGLTPSEQKRLGQHELMNTPFETIERNIRTQLSSMLGAGGFEPATDILAITVNRWAHGYAAWYNSLFDPIYEDDDDERYSHVIARKPLGRITIANADAAASPMLEAAVEQGHRAVTELAR